MDENGLVRQQRDEPHQLVQRHLKVFGSHELLTQIFQTAVAACDLLGSASRENEFKRLPADFDFCVSVVFHCVQPPFKR